MFRATVAGGAANQGGEVSDQQFNTHIFVLRTVHLCPVAHTLQCRQRQEERNRQTTPRKLSVLSSSDGDNATSSTNSNNNNTAPIPNLHHIHPVDDEHVRMSVDEKATDDFYTNAKQMRVALEKKDSIFDLNEFQAIRYVVCRGVRRCVEHVGMDVGV